MTNSPFDELDSVTPDGPAGGYFILVVYQITGIISDRKQKLTRHWTRWFGLFAHLAINLVTAGIIAAAVYSS